MDDDMSRTDFLNEDGYERTPSPETQALCLMAAEQIRQLHMNLSGLDIDALQDALALLDEAQAVAKCAAIT